MICLNLKNRKCYDLGLSSLFDTVVVNLDRKNFKKSIKDFYEIS